MKKKIWLSPPHMGGEEEGFVKEAFETNWISPVGPHISAFEDELSSYLEGVGVAALSSGTAAIHLALLLLDVNQGDEVICSTFTFSASINPVRYVGAVPVFVDSERDTWGMDPELLEKTIKDRINAGRKPKAIIVVHLYGMPAQMNDIMRLARVYEIPVIEDAAEALGSTYDGKPAGTLADIGVLSFNGNKIITTSGGGALLSRNTAHITRARFLATQARDPAPHYEHSVIGYNYRLSNVCAGIGRGQLRVLDNRVKQRREVFDYYIRKLAQEHFSFLAEPVGTFSNRWLSCMVSTGNVRPGLIREALEKENIESRPLWKPMHLQPVFRGCKSFLNGVSEYAFTRGICLPSGSNLTTADLDRITDVIIRLFN